MGWADCGQDSRGRNIGYAWEGRCDHPGCNRRIWRGVDAACGGMHGTGDVRSGDDKIEWGDYNCEGYFCDAHQRMPCTEHEDGAELYAPTLCETCASKLERDYRENEEWRAHWPTDEPPLPLETAQGMAARSDETQGRLGSQGQQPGPKDPPTPRPEAGEGVE